jgi:hypothetical protein
VTGQAFRPISTATFWLEARWHGLGVLPMRAENVVLHALAGLLLGLLLQKRLPNSRASLFGALLFTLHPAATEAVMFLSARHDLLGGVFCLWALLGAGSSSVTVRTVGVFVLTALAVGCKETYVVTVPLVLVAAFTADGDGTDVARAARRDGVVAAVAAGAAAATVFLVRAVLGVSSASGLALSVPDLARAYAALVVHHVTAFATFTDAPTAERFVALSLHSSRAPPISSTYRALPVGGLRIPRPFGEERHGVSGRVHRSPVKFWAVGSWAA